MQASPEPTGTTVPPRPARASLLPFGRPAAYAAEFVGTLLLVLFILLIVCVDRNIATAEAATIFGTLNLPLLGLVHAFILMLLVAALGGASGAHFNPAVTVALAAKRLISVFDALIYIIVQLAGAVVAALLVKFLIHDLAVAANLGAPAITKGNFMKGNIPRAMVAELIGTFGLVWAVMATAVNPRGNRNLAPFVIGSALGLGVMTFGAMTGGSLNPARAFGPLVIGHFGSFEVFILTYVVGPIVGGLLAAFLYTAVVLRPELRFARRPIDTLD